MQQTEIGESVLVPETLDGLKRNNLVFWPGHVGIMTGKGKSWVLITPETPPEDAAQIGAEVKQRGLKTISVYGDVKLAEMLIARGAQPAPEKLADRGVGLKSLLR